jgi:lysophospholipase L1-like esterase
MKLDSRTSPTLHGREFPADMKSRFDGIVTNWAQSSLSIDAMCRARGIAYLHVLQPNLHDEGSKPLTAEERRTGTAWPAWIEGAREGYPRLRAQGAALREKGIHFVDGSMIFRDVTETLYYDAGHFNEAGNVILARAIAAALQGEIDLTRVGSGR